MNIIEKDDIITTDKYLSLQSGKICYIKTDLLYNSWNSMIWRNNIHTLKPSKVWITGHSDYSIDNSLFNKYQHNCDTWFTINKDVDNKKIHALPLGITNFTNESGLHPIYGNIDIMFDVLSQPRDIKNLVYLNFNIYTYRDERQICYNMFYNKPYVTVGEIINTLEGRARYLKEIRDHKFVLCPRGNGIDTHRLWETLYMGSIPIVKRCCAMNEFTDLPILFIDDWSEVDNEDFLENKYKEITGLTWNLDKIKFSYWKKLIIDNT
jgi:hypothetical protein